MSKAGIKNGNFLGSSIKIEQTCYPVGNSRIWLYIVNVRDLCNDGLTELAICVRKAARTF